MKPNHVLKMKRFVFVCLLLLLGLGLFGNFMPGVRGEVTGSSWVTEISGLPFIPTHACADTKGNIYARGTTGYLYKSTDRGITWTQLTGVSEYHYVDSHDNVYAYSGSWLKRSSDGGTTWNNVQDVTGVTKLWHWDEDSQGNVYVNTYQAAGGDNLDCVYRGTNNGASWSVWFNITQIDSPVRHLHTVDVAPNDYVFVTSGDAHLSPYDDGMIYRWNTMAWERIVKSNMTVSPYHLETASTKIMFLNNYAYLGTDEYDYLLRLRITGANTWSQREWVSTQKEYSASDLIYFGTEPNNYEFMIFSTSGKIIASWDGKHFVKIWESSSEASEIPMSEARRFPIYWVAQSKLYVLENLTKEDLIHLYYKKYNSIRGSVSNTENYALEQRITNGTNYLDLTTVAIKDATISLKGLSKYNKLTNGGFETGSTTGWTASLVTVEQADKYEGSYSARSDIGNLRQEFTVTKGTVLLWSIWIKSNTTLTNAMRVDCTNITGTPVGLQTTYINSTTSWRKVSNFLVFPTGQTWTLRWYFKYNNVAGARTWLDACLIRFLEVGYAYREAIGQDSISNDEAYTFDDYFLSSLDTTNPSILILGQTISHTGTLTNGSQSSPTSLNQVATGSIEVEANIGGSGQAILRLTGTRVFYEDSIILQTRKDTVYCGRYYGTFSLTTNTTDLIVATNLQANIASLSATVNKLTLTVSAPSGTTSTTKVYVGDKGEPREVIGASSYSYDGSTKILTIAKTHSSSATIIVDWTPTGSMPFDEKVHWIAVAIVLVIVFIYRYQPHTKTRRAKQISRSKFKTRLLYSLFLPSWHQ